MLIHGDNLLALKALEENYTNAVKCIYIDPPYNTGNAFEHYDDGLEHSIWLSLMRERLIILRNLLTEDGSIWISIDADECHYLKVLCDEIFGRPNFIDEVIWQRSYAPINLKKTLSRCHDAILVYAKNKTDKFELNRLPRSIDANNRYKNPDNDPRGVWKSSDLSVGPAVQENIYPITTPTGRICYPPEGYSWRLSQNRFQEYLNDNRIWFGPTGNNVPSIKRFLSEVKDGIVAQTLWTYQEVGHNQDAKKEIKAFGFKFYELAPSLLKEDKFGNLVINKEYNADMLAAAMAKQEGFTYAPSVDVYWKQGYSSESDFIYTTTQFMTVEGLAAIRETMAEGESLLICCTSFQKECKQAFSNISIKKIPQMLLGRCEFAHDDYSLNIIELPHIDDEEEELMEEE